MNKQSKTEFMQEANKAMPDAELHEFEYSDYADLDAPAWDRLCAICGSHKRTDTCQDVLQNDLTLKQMDELQVLIDGAIDMLIRNKAVHGERFGQGNEPVRLMNKAWTIIGDMKLQVQKEIRLNE